MIEKVYVSIPRKSLEAARERLLDDLNALTDGKAERAIELAMAYKDLDEALEE